MSGLPSKSVGGCRCHDETGGLGHSQELASVYELQIVPTRMWIWLEARQPFVKMIQKFGS